jgi:hypothetical protein
LNKEIGTTWSQIFLFDVPDLGFLSKILIESTITSADDETNDVSSIEQYLGENMFDYIELRTSRGFQLISSVRPEYLKMRRDTSNYDLLTKLNVAMTPSNNLINGAIGNVVTPCFFNIFEHPSKFLDTRHTEKLIIVAKVADSYLDAGLTGEISSITYKAHFTFFVPDTLDLYKEDNKIVKLLHDCFYERSYDCPADTNGIIELKNIEVNRKVFATHLLLIDDNKRRANINNVSIKINGTDFYDASHNINILDEGWYGKEGIETDNIESGHEGNNNTYSINWGLFLDRNRDTGGINFNDIKPVDIEVRYSTSNDYTLKVFHEYYEFLEINSNGNLIKKYIY